MKERIKNHLTDNPSYLKWGVSRLSLKFSCSEKTIKSILKDLQGVKKDYVQGPKTLVF